MNVKIRLPRPLRDAIRKDLMRPHPFAVERVGFMYARLVRASDPIILMHQYEPICDNDYVKDESVGACINSNAIRKAMQRALSSSTGVFHVHMHMHDGIPGFSRIDRREITRLTPSFQAVSPTCAHGAMLFSETDIAARVWLPVTKEAAPCRRITVVGWPLEITGGIDDE